MAKSQRRSSREVRKPKAIVVKPTLAVDARQTDVGKLFKKPKGKP
jgi:hypothetical protein